MNRIGTVDRRADAERARQSKPRRIERKKLIIAGCATVLFAGFVWVALGNDDEAGLSGVRVDALGREAGSRYGLLTARGPEEEQAERESIDENIAVASVPDIVAPEADRDSLDKALASIDKLNAYIIALQGDLTDAKVSESQTQSELQAARENLQLLQAKFDEREKTFETELAKAIAEAEARVLANMGNTAPEGLSEEEKRRLEELRRQRDRQNKSDGIVFDENPLGRK